ncbi:MAG: TolC family protein [bacterium]|nr:TolC family protein [bacterium]
MKPTIIQSAAVTVAILFAGCTAHYRQGLEVWRRAEPLSFTRKTMAWVDAADRAATASQPAAKLPSVREDRPTTSPQDAFLDMAGRFFEMEPAALAARLEKLRDPAQAARVLAGSFTLRDLLTAVALHNPSVKAARDRWQATLSQFSQADYLDQLVNQYRTFTRYLNVETGKPLNKQMEQNFFPYPSTIALKGEMIREEIRMAELEWQMALRDAAIEAGTSFFSYQYLGRTEATTAENVTLVGGLIDVVNDRYRSGSASQADLLRVQTELERQRNMLEDIQSERRSAAAAINALLDRPAKAPLGPPAAGDLAPVPPSLASLTESALERRQEVGQQAARLQSAALAIRLGEVMNRPLASQGYSLFERGMMPEAEMPDGAGAPAGAGMSVGASMTESRRPYGLEAKTQERPDFAQAEAYLTEMRRRLAGEQATLNQVKAQTRSMALAYLQDLDIARREDQLIREIVLPHSRSAYEADLAAYTTGQVSFVDLLDAERGLLDARLELDRARRDLNQTLIRIPAVSGSLPAAFTR